jgi:hypothetical protein
VYTVAYVLWVDAGGVQVPVARQLEGVTMDAFWIDLNFDIEYDPKFAAVYNEQYMRIILFDEISNWFNY